MKKVLVYSLILLCVSCNKDENDVARQIKFKGVVQKGPFLEGTEVSIQNLTTDLNPSGIVYITETDDDFGSFVLNDITPGLYETFVDGYYYNELTGALSTSTIRLKSIVNALTDKTVNTNVLTTLAFDRIKYLMQSENKPFDEAQQKAQIEVLKIFNIVSDDLTFSFEEVDLSKSERESSILLAVSCLLQNGNNEPELAELITKISNDLETDGELNDPSINDRLSLSQKSFNQEIVVWITDNLRQRYYDLGVTLEIPDFSAYLNLDGDGVIDQDYPPAPYPTIDKLSGVYDSDIIVTLGPSNSSVYYTLDGSEPTLSSPTFNDPISITGDGTLVTLKAFSGGPGYKKSPTISSTYKIDYSSDIDNPITTFNLSDHKTAMTGRWAGYYLQYHMDPSFIWRNVELNIQADGKFVLDVTFSSWSENPTYIPDTFENIIQFNLKNVSPDGKAAGDVILSGLYMQDYYKIRNVSFANDGDYLSFLLDLYGWSYEFKLVRVL